jgi:hypothetical protein
MASEIFIVTRLHAAPRNREAVRAAMYRVQGPTRAIRNMK